MDRHIDDTIRSIGTDRMDDFEKRALLDKIQERDKIKNIRENAKNAPPRAPEQNKQRPAAARPAASPAAAPGAAPAQAVRRPTAPPQPQKVKKPQVQQTPAVKKQRGHLIERLFLRFRSSGVMQGEYLSQRFLGFLHGKTRDRLFDLGLVTSSLAHPTDEFQPRLVAAMANLGSNYYELVVRLDELHDKTLLNGLAEFYSPGTPKLVKPETIGPELITLFKRIYILRDYAQSAETAAIRALEIEAQAEGKSNSVLSFNIQRARRSIDFIFDELQSSLHIAILNIPRRYWGYGHPDLEDMLKLGPEDRVGSMTEKLMRELKNPKSEKSDSAEKSESKGKEKSQPGKKELPKIYASHYPSNVQLGLAIMKSYSLEEETEIASGRDIPVAYMGENSKMFYTVIFFEIFDREYSCMFSGNRIKTAIDYQDGERRDAHKLLEDSLYALDETRNNLKELNRITMEHHNIQSSTRLTPVQRAASLDKLAQAQERADLQTRSHLGNALGRAEATLKLLIDARHMIRNPEEIIHFKFSDAEKRRLEGCSIMDAIEETYGFVSAMRTRLVIGDLAGSGKEIAQEMVFDMRVTRPERPKPDEAERAEPRDSAKNETKADLPTVETMTPGAANPAPGGLSGTTAELAAALAGPMPKPKVPAAPGAQNAAPRKPSLAEELNAANQANKPAAPGAQNAAPRKPSLAEELNATNQAHRPAAPGAQSTAPRPAAPGTQSAAPRPAAPGTQNAAPRPAAPGAAPRKPSLAEELNAANAAPKPPVPPQKG
ncbi:MAG: hypothetical protein LBC99_03320 [Spirochaetota bacterium]|nr:hypothetical protein [Spirochaetota bacterium]